MTTSLEVGELIHGIVYAPASAYALLFDCSRDVETQMVRRERYGVVRMIHLSAKSRVYLVVRRDGQRALLRFANLDQPAAAASHAEANFLAEAKAQFALARRHRAENQPVLGMSDDGLFLETRFIAGRTLGTMLRAEGTVTLETACIVVHALCQRLARLHDAGMVYCALKPDHVIVSDEVDQTGWISSVVDCGLCWQPTRSVAEIELWCSRWAESSDVHLYAAPELFDGDIPVVASDVFSVGALLFELLTGSQAFRTISSGFALQLPLPARAVPEVPPPLLAVIHKCFAERPEDRYPCMAYLRDALSRACRQAQAERKNVSSTTQAARVVALSDWLSTRKAALPNPSNSEEQ